MIYSNELSLTDKRKSTSLQRYVPLCTGKDNCQHTNCPALVHTDIALPDFTTELPLSKDWPSGQPTVTTC